MSVLEFHQEQEIFGENFSRPLGLGLEFELVQRAAKVQIIKNLPFYTAQLQMKWDKHDEEYAKILGLQQKKIEIPRLDKNHIYTGVESVSMLEANLDLWPSILVYCRNATAYPIQEDQFDTYSCPLKIEVLCKNGPVKDENVHSSEGIESQQILDSELSRLCDAVLLCIRKDPSLGGIVDGLEKGKITPSLPWARNENKNATGQTYIFQAKQFEFTVQKISF